jgi:tripartite-type tricarboxylate transporter receptor subunit TctC
LQVVHYAGGGPGLKAMIAGEAQVMFEPMSASIGPVRAGQLRALAVTSAERYPEFPDVPTLAQAGVPGQESAFIQCVLAPAGTPKPVIDILYREIARMIVLPDVKERLAAIGFTPVANTPEAFGVELQAQVALWAKVIHDAKIPKIE